MTNERIAIEALARCTFLPGSWNKRFAKGLAAQPEGTLITVKQRQCLWKLVHRYRRQMPPICLEFLKARDEMDLAQLGFEDQLDSAPDNTALRLVYADWLDEHGDESLALAQRWMVEQGIFPHLTAGGVSYGQETKAINFDWTLGMTAWELFRHTPYHRFSYHNHTRREAERNLADLLSPKEKLFSRA